MRNSPRSDTRNSLGTGSTPGFGVNTESGRVVVKITDMTTRELIKQILRKEMLALAKALDRLQLLFQTKV